MKYNSEIVDKLEWALHLALVDHNIDAMVNAVAINTDIIEINIPELGKLFKFKNGVLAIYDRDEKGLSVTDVHFNCEHILDSDVEVTAVFLLNISKIITPEHCESPEAN